jgi:hypothetical protein
MLYAGSNLDKAREVFAAAIYHRPRIWLTIRQRTHVLEARGIPTARGGRWAATQVRDIVLRSMK